MEVTSVMQDHTRKDFGFIADKAELIGLITDSMKLMPFGCKVNSYSVNPFIAKEICENIPNFKYFANVTHHNQNKDVTEMSKNIFPKTVKLNKFDTLGEAVLWVREGLKIKGSGFLFPVFIFQI